MPLGYRNCIQSGGWIISFNPTIISTIQVVPQHLLSIQMVSTPHLSPHHIYFHKKRNRKQKRKIQIKKKTNALAQKQNRFYITKQQKQRKKKKNKTY